MKALGLPDRWRSWRSADARASSKYLTARALDIDRLAEELVEESSETQRIVLVKTELQSPTYAGSSRMSAIAIFVAAVASSGTLIVALLVPLLSTSLTAVMGQYGLDGQLPRHVESFVNKMIGTTSQPLLTIVAVLVAVAFLALASSLTRDSDGAVATMRFTRYRDAGRSSGPRECVGAAAEDRAFRAAPPVAARRAATRQITTRLPS